MLPQQLQIIEQEVSNLSSRIRILFFQSDDREIIDKAVDESTALRSLLGLKKEDTFRSMLSAGTALSILDRYNIHPLGGRLMNKSTVLSRIMDEKLRIQLEGTIPSDEQIKYFFFKDFETIDKKEQRTNVIKSFIDGQERYFCRAYLLISSPSKSLPNLLTEHIGFIQLGLPSTDDIWELLMGHICKEQKERQQCGDYFETYSKAEINRFASQMNGLTSCQLNNVFHYFDSRFCTKLKEDLGKVVWKEKRQEGLKSGVIHYINVAENPGVVGAGNFNRWLNRRLVDLEDPVRARRNGTPAPRGILLAGVPGTGKSQLAKMMTWCWSNYRVGQKFPISLIEFDIGRLSSKNYGESEEKMDTFLTRIAANEPGIMFIDEIEKIFHRPNEKGNGGMHEVKEAQMGKLLGWMQEHKENIVSFFTANNIDRLPPELLRDGRISARFFVFLPSYYDLLQMIFIKLRPLQQAKRFGLKFNEEIQAVCEKIDSNIQGKCSDNELRSILKKSSQSQVLIRLAQWAQEEKNHRTPFMTGANVNTLLENTFRLLREEDKLLSDCDGDFFCHKMTECCCRLDFIPEGQSNMDNIVRIYLQGKKYEYEDISANALLPFHCFCDGRFLRDKLPETDNEYDEFLQRTFIEKLERPAVKLAKEKERHKIRDEYEFLMLGQAKENKKNRER